MCFRVRESFLITIAITSCNGRDCYEKSVNVTIVKNLHSVCNKWVCIYMNGSTYLRSVAQGSGRKIFLRATCVWRANFTRCHFILMACSTYLWFKLGSCKVTLELRRPTRNCILGQRYSLDLPYRSVDFAQVSTALDYSRSKRSRGSSPFTRAWQFFPLIPVSVSQNPIASKQKPCHKTLWRHTVSGVSGGGKLIYGGCGPPSPHPRAVPAL